MNVGWVIFFAFLALLYGFLTIGHFAAKYQRKKELDAKQDEAQAATLKRMKESEKRAEEAQAVLDELRKKETERIAVFNNETGKEKVPEKAEPVSKSEPKPKSEYRWEERDGCYYLIYDGLQKFNFNPKTWGDIKDSVTKGETFDIPFKDGGLGYKISGLVAPISGILFVFIFGKSGINPGDEIMMINPKPEALEKLKIHIEKIRERERMDDEERDRRQKEWERQRAESEKREIARKIKEKYRKRELEKIVRQELIDSGELFGDQPKRPPIPREVVDAVYRRDGGRCVYCGSTKDLQIDHIIPFSRGGSSELENLQLLCRKCNIEKSNKIG